MGFEIHPETPPEGTNLTDRFSRLQVEQMYQNLRARGTAFGIIFGDLTLLSNSRLAMEVAEFARDRGKFEPLHESLFRAYFTDTQDIGRHDVIMEMAAQIGLDTTALREALEQHTYAERLDNVTREAHQLGITAAPTFIVNDMYKIVGAHPLEVFQDLFTKIAAGEEIS